MVSRVSDTHVKSPSENPGWPDWIVAARAELAGTRFADVRFVAETGSTNADLLAAATGGAAERALVADYQRAGRGRLDRRWEAPRGANLLVSVLVRPHAPAERWALLTTAMALAVTDALGAAAALAAIRWPNDVIAPGAGERKLAGVLAESTADAVVVGVGLNVGWPAEPGDAPELHATSIAALGHRTDRAHWLAAVLARFAARVAQVETDPAALAAAHRARSATLGRDVRVSLHDGRRIEGTAQAIDDDGSLVVAHAGGPTRYRFGEVMHLG